MPDVKGSINYVKYIGNSIIKSYSQIFFSNNPIFSYLILFATFLNPYVGFSGLLAVILSVYFAQWLGFEKELIKEGVFSFNGLMIGLVIGLYFHYSFQFLLLLAISCFFCVILSKALMVIFHKYGLPILGLPFIVSLWILLLSSKNFSSLHLTERGIYTYNELFAVGGLSLVHAYENVNSIHLPFVLESYFKALGAIYFQYNIIAGMLIALGLLIYSRIAFTLSLIGFLTGYAIFAAFNDDLSHFTYGYIGFNYILAAISIGGFYLVPSRKTYLLAIAIAALIAVVHSALGYIFIKVQLPLFSLPSSLGVLLLLLTLRHRNAINGLNLVYLQSYSPEKNLYQFKLRNERYKNDTYTPIHLPFFGEWFISQGHDGGITHLGDWKYAWDFVVTDEHQKTFRLPGTNLSDFYCYNIPVVAPAYGYVYDIIDGIKDNSIGDVDVQNNWGNTIILKHGDYLFTKLSHLKEGSFKVKIGDYVRKGDIVASCGSSGRSPEPHIHFQIQSTPFVGSATIPYPISYFITRNYKIFKFHSFEVPAENMHVIGVATTPLIVNSFKFIPGEKFVFEYNASPTSPLSPLSKDGQWIRETWEVFTDAYNSSYLFCHETQASAFFVNNGTLHYFTNYYGSKKSLLYYFYLGAHKVVMGYYHEMGIDDLLPIDSFYNGPFMVIQDFLSPFAILLKSTFNLQYHSIDDLNFATSIELRSNAQLSLFGKQLEAIHFKFLLEKNEIKTFTVRSKKFEIEARCVSN